MFTWETTMLRLPAVAAVAALGTLAGCTTVPYTAPLTPGQKDCRGQQVCTIDVDPANGVVPRDILASRGRTTVLQWKLVSSSGQTWMGRGIEFEPAASGVISCPEMQAGPVRTCTNNGGMGTTEGRFKYTVRYIEWARSQVVEVDPFVLNQ
jgi:hypothetical protein